LNPLVHYFAGCEQQDGLAAAGLQAALAAAGQDFAASAGQHFAASVGQHFADVSSFLATIFAVIIVPAARMIAQKTNLFQRLLLFCGIQHPSLHPQS
jgi:hypothetical protein